MHVVQIQWKNLKNIESYIAENMSPRILSQIEKNVIILLYFFLDILYINLFILLVKLNSYCYTPLYPNFFS